MYVLGVGSRRHGYHNLTPLKHLGVWRPQRGERERAVVVVVVVVVVDVAVVGGGGGGGGGVVVVVVVVVE